MCRYVQYVLVLVPRYFDCVVSTKLDIIPGIHINHSDFFHNSNLVDGSGGPVDVHGHISMGARRSCYLDRTARRYASGWFPAPFGCHKTTDSAKLSAKSLAGPIQFTPAR